MFRLLSSLLRLLLLPRSFREVALENLALRQQLAVIKRRRPRSRLQIADRIFWVWLSTVWSHWRQALMIVRPETVVSWYRKGFRLFWNWISRRKQLARREAYFALLRGTTSENGRLGTRVQGLSWAACRVGDDTDQSTRV